MLELMQEPMEHDNGASVLSNNAVVEISPDIIKAFVTNQQIEITLEKWLAGGGCPKAYKHTDNLYSIHVRHQDHVNFLCTKTKNRVGAA